MADRSSGNVAALVVAGGRGSRAGAGAPKQYRRIGAEPIMTMSLRPFLDHPAINQVLPVIHPDDEALFAASTTPHAKLCAPAHGGATRQESVRLGLEALADDPPRLVLIHDAARPFVTSAILDRVIAALDDGPAALAAVPLADTLKRAEGGIVTGTPSRSGLYLAQTPQGFDFAAILAAHRRAAAVEEPFTDDAAIAEYAGLAVQIVAGDPANSKITTEEDIVMAQQRLGATKETRVGNGYDVHATEPGSGVRLGGVDIAADFKLKGHSDADVVLHALTDALLGAIADADIGAHFPPSDETWRNADSSQFLAEAVRRVSERGGTISNLDATVIAEAPKVGPHRDAMRMRIAEICGIAVERVSVKATTSERLGFVGRSEGIAAHATAAIRLPTEDS